MILKKPYAFLIKHFKVIHIVITVFLVLIAYDTYNVYRFFNRYIASNYTTSVTIGLQDMYTPPMFFVTILVAIALVTVVLVLFIHKKKAFNLYISIVVYYAILFAYFIYVSSVLGGFEQALVESTVARSIRDITLISVLPQLVFIVFSVLRSIGLNLKHLNFVNDLKELEYSDQDAEEVEININFDTYKAQRSVRRAFRELVYYVLENKFIVICIAGVLLVIGVYYVSTHRQANYDSNYSIGQTFTYQNLSVTIGNSMVTNLDYNGSVIKEGSYFLVLNINIKNDSGSTVGVDYNNFKIEVGNDSLTPNNNFSTYFVDYAEPNLVSSFTHRLEKDIILVYELDKSHVNKSMTLKIYNGTAYSAGEYFTRNIYIKVKPEKMSDLKLEGNYKLGKKILLTDTYLGNTSFVVNDFSFEKSYIYEYEKCEKDNCTTYKDMITLPFVNNRNNNVLLILQTELILDKNTNYGVNYPRNTSFAEYFVDIQYKVGDEIYRENAVNVTPDNNLNFLAFELPPEAEEASVLQVVVTVRNKEYIINLKA